MAETTPNSAPNVTPAPVPNAQLEAQQAPQTESIANTGLSLPPAPNFSAAALQGGMQQILSQNLGRFVICEFLIGADCLANRAGILEYVGANALVLYDEADQEHLVCDTEPLRFVTFSTPEQQPAEEPAPIEPSVPQQPSTPPPSAQSPSQTIPTPNSLTPLIPQGIRAVNAPAPMKAAFNYAKRKTRP